MRDLTQLKLIPGLKRLPVMETHHWGQHPPERAGIFVLRSEDDGKIIRVIATNSDDWDHVSVSREDRAPTWMEMEQVKRIFFHKSEMAYQLHVKVKNHINIHPNCLHMWRPHNIEIPVPPLEMV